MYIQVLLNDDILKTIYDKSTDLVFKGTKIKKIRKFLNFCLQSFFYSDKVFRQAESITMGSPLTPILTKWFVTSKENIQLQKQSMRPT